MRVSKECLEDLYERCQNMYEKFWFKSDTKYGSGKVGEFDFAKIDLVSEMIVINGEYIHFTDFFPTVYNINLDSINKITITYLEGADDKEGVL